MDISAPSHKIMVTSPRECEGYLMAELGALGYAAETAGPTVVSTSGSFEDAMRMNLWLRTAHRVLLELAAFEADSLDALYKKVSALPWHRLIAPEEFLSITASTSNAPDIRDTRIVSLKAKDAIVDRIRSETSRRPDSGPGRGGVVIHLHWAGQTVTVSLDTSGEPLSHRGYRRFPHKAPMRETLAAAVVLATGWRGPGDGQFINPMCGSGTLAIEAALIALKRAPGAIRGDFGFMHVSGYNKFSKAWEAMLAEALEGQGAPKGVRILASDKDREAVKAALKNAQAAGVGGAIGFEVCDFAAATIPENATGVVVINPEYGERLGQGPAIDALYGRIGDFFKQRCAGHTGYVFTGNAEAAKRIGLRTRSRTPFYNGPIECRLLAYDLYDGTRKSASD